MIKLSVSAWQHDADGPTDTYDTEQLHPLTISVPKGQGTDYYFNALRKAGAIFYPKEVLGTTPEVINIIIILLINAEWGPAKKLLLGKN